RLRHCPRRRNHRGGRRAVPDREHMLSVSASVGVAIAAKDGQSLDDLLKCADLAMYRAKENGRGESGRGTYRIFDPTMDEAARAALQLKLDMHKALAN